ncbi:MAG: OsmC family protein [Ilumatobacter sp.]
MSDTQARPADNGVNVAHLLGARQALTETPAAAAFEWRARCEWVGGTHSRTVVDGYSGLGAEHLHRQSYAIEADHPEVFASADNGMTPTEIVLAALASCLTAGVASVAQNRGVQLHSVAATIRGTMDLQGVLGIDPDVRNGFDGITVTYEIDADASTDDIEAIVAQSQKRSAVFDIVTNPTSVTVEVV